MIFAKKLKLHALLNKEQNEQVSDATEAQEYYISSIHKNKEATQSVASLLCCMAKQPAALPEYYEQVKIVFAQCL